LIILEKKKKKKFFKEFLVSKPEIKKKIYLKGAFDSAQIHRMTGIIYQFSDAAKKLSRYQAKTSQVYVRIFHQCTKTKISIKKT
jgi:hypothetical protein